jgi:hypothetical protein
MVEGGMSLLKFEDAPYLPERLEKLQLAWDRGTPNDISTAAKDVASSTMDVVDKVALAAGATRALKAAPPSRGGASTSKLPPYGGLQETPTVALGATGTGGTWGGFTPTARAAELAEQLVRPGDMVEIPRGSTRLADIASLASSEGVEFAVIRMGESRFLVRGTINTTTIPVGSKLIIHVHPGGGYMGLSPSAEDVDALGLLGQERSALLNESGAWRTFGPEGAGSYVYNYQGQ